MYVNVRISNGWSDASSGSQMTDMRRSLSVLLFVAAEVVVGLVVVVVAVKNSGE